jgi:hypothetical protein
MRRKIDRPVLDTVFVFGAGASHDASRALDPSALHTAPLDKDFCTRIETYSRSRTCPEWVRKSALSIVDSWKDSKSFSDCGLEEAVLLQATHLNFLNAIQPRRRQGLLTEIEFVYELVHVVVYVLRHCKEKPSAPYRQIARQFFGGNVLNTVKNRAITFNYDTLFDGHLLDRFDPKQVYFDEIAEGDTQIKCDDPLLLKLHGSANWFVDLDTYETILSGPRDADPYYIDEIGLISGMSPAPDHSRCPLIIPPISNKPVTSISLFRFLWSRASEYLEGAKKIVICGYSLPEADILARTLFKSVRNRNVTDITIVDPDGSSLAKWKVMLNEKVNRGVHWHYYSTFSEYVHDISDR